MTKQYTIRSEAGSDGYFDFGKYRSKHVSEVAETEVGLQYLEWCLTQDGLPSAFREVISKTVQREKKARIPITPPKHPIFYQHEKKENKDDSFEFKSRFTHYPPKENNRFAKPLQDLPK